jgi:hypothetical protein
MALPAQNLQSVGSTIFGTGDDKPSGKTFTARVFIDSQRVRDLDRRQQYYDCTNHDSKRHDFDGRILEVKEGGMAFTQPQLSSAKASEYVPLRSRRPSAPYRLSRAIVNSFTNFVFGEGRFPQLRVPGDDDSQDFLQTCSKVGLLPLKVVRARNLGGAVGTVGMAWSFFQGKPRFTVHNGKNLFVHEWEDREGLIPEHVTECYQATQEEWDPLKKKVVRNAYWMRRDWTKEAEIVFLPSLVVPDQEPEWEPDVDKSVIHNDRDTHFTWIQNLPSEEEDGLPDYEGQYEALDEIDVLLSVIVRGAKLNLDPTLVINADMLFANRMGIKKGSDNALIVDKEGGDAKYLELSGAGITAGIALFNEFRKTILETAECVIPDPDQIAAQGQSAAAQKMVFGRMLSKGGILQEQYGTGLQRLLEPVLFIAQARVQNPVQVTDEDGNISDVDQSFDLPHRVEPQDVLGDDGAPTGEQVPNMTERHPGAGTDVELEWPPRFPPTALDQQQLVTTMSTATGAQPFVSQQTATEIVMGAFGRDGADEWARVQKDKKQQDQKESDMMADQNGAAGGKPGTPGAPPAKPPGGGGGKPGKPGGGDGGLGDSASKPPEGPAD